MTTEATQDALTDYQRQLLDLYEVFAEVCERNGIEYFAVGGTALGAVRHKGFIPWDDDIDVSMPRGDYDRMCAADSAIGLPEGYRCHHDSNLLYGVFEDTNTRIEHGNAAWDEAQPYLSIDITPLDGAPARAIPRLLHFARCFGAFAAIKLKRIAYIQETEGLKNRGETRPKVEQLLIRFGGAVGVLLRPFSEEGLVTMFEELSRRFPYEGSDVVGCYVGRYRTREFFPRAVFGDGRMERFCGMPMRVYSQVETYLRSLYGDDYMTIPPASRRERHGDARIADTATAGIAMGTAS